MSRSLHKLDNLEEIFKKYKIKKFERFDRFWLNSIPKVLDRGLYLSEVLGW